MQASILASARLMSMELQSTPGRCGSSAEARSVFAQTPALRVYRHRRRVRRQYAFRAQACIGGSADSGRTAHQKSGVSGSHCWRSTAALTQRDETDTTATWQREMDAAFAVAYRWRRNRPFSAETDRQSSARRCGSTPSKLRTVCIVANCGDASRVQQGLRQDLHAARCTR